MTSVATRPVRRTAPPVDADRAPLFLRVILWVLPTVSAFGGLLPGLGPLFLARVLAVVLLVVVIALPRRLSRGRIAILPVAVIWLLFFAAGFVAPTDLTLALKMTLPVVFGLATIAALERVGPTPGVVSSLLTGWVVAFLVTGLLGAREALTGQHLPNYLSGSDLERIDTRLVASVFGNPNAFATFLVMVLPVLAAVGLRSRRTSTSVAAFGMVGLDLALLLVTGSRLGAISAALVVIGMLVMLGAKRAVAVGTVGLVLGAGALMVFGDRLIPLLPEKVGRFVGLLLGDSSVTQDASYGSRTDIYANGVYLLTQSKGLGLGPGSFEANLTSTALPYPTGGIHSPHNAFLEIAVEAGVITLVALLVWMWRAGRLAREGLASQDRQTRSIAVVALASMLGALPMTLSNSSWVTATTNWCWLATIGAIAAHLAAHRTSRE